MAQKYGFYGKMFQKYSFSRKKNNKKYSFYEEMTKKYSFFVKGS
jgi:hypothetical protein